MAPLLSTILFTPCYPAWEMMEGEAVENHPTNFQNPPNQGSAHLPILHWYLCCRNQVFESLIRHQIQALIVCFFIIKDKEEALRWLTCTDFSSVTEESQSSRANN
ncbi:hypothetical protein G6M26_11435 [Agrobacterium tumefaciens]|nr:hypothetical protein [Agrobacterium tumefaciens]NTE19135.1 hypothetical protein [Agrobacterium tumefaciens]